MHKMTPMRFAPLMLRAPLVACAALFVACAAGAPKAVEYDAPLGAEFTAATGKPVRMDGISIVFVKLVEDSRCPKNVTCIWQGEAKVALTALVGANAHELTLSTQPPAAASADVEGFRIELRDVAPYPDATVRRASMDYTVKLRVTRIE